MYSATWPAISQRNEAKMNRSQGRPTETFLPKDRPFHGHAESEATLSWLLLLDECGEILMS
jgi:hypothetical protein